MNLRQVACAVAGFCLVAGTALADAPKKKAGDAPKAAAGGDGAAMMAAMEKANAMGDAHKKMQQMVGSWTTMTKMWMQPGAPPSEVTGQAEVKSIMGGRYLEEHFTATMMGKPFEGMGLTGYDNAKKAYVGTWIDSMGTGIMMSTGTLDASGKVMTSTGTEMDAMTGKEKTMKIVDKWEGDKKHVAEFFSKGPDGKEMKMMEITYTKK
jgi:hypothetical protein